MLTRRAREDVLEDLGHVRFVLSDMGKWADSEVPVSARKYVRGRYQQMERVLRTVIETPEGEVPEVTSWQTPPLAPVVAPVVVPEPSPSAADASAAFDSAQSAEAPFDFAQGERAVSSEPEPPLTPMLPAFEIPHTPTPDEQVVEEASKWNEVWKPFLYERIGWFIGAFLILAGSFYFVAVSWSGMSALMQTLVVFGLTAGYSAAFSVGGALLGRRENFDSAGKVLMLIGSAVAPLANLAFQTPGVERIVGIPLSIGWALLAAVLFGIAAKAIDAKTQRPMQLLMLASAASMALSPLLIGGGTAMLWINLVPLALVNRVWRHDGERSGEATWFAVFAPLYLTALFSIRLHITLQSGAVLPHVATYAPFVALLLLNTLKLRKLAAERASDALAVAVVAAQVGLLFASAFGEAPALFACCALLGVTTWQLSKGDNVARVGWLYGTYVAAQFAYQTCGQLVPGVLAKLIAAAKSALGYAATAPMPFNFDAVVALPCVIAGAILAVRLLAKAEARNDARLRAVGEVLLRSTAGASVLFAAISFAGRDLRAAFWSIPVYALLCLGLGQWLSRKYLVIAGAFILVATPIFTFNLFGSAAAAVSAGAVALLLALFSVIQTNETRSGVSWAAGILAAAAVGLGWLAAPPAFSGVLAVVLGGASGLLIARNLGRAGLLSISTAVLVSAVPLFFLAFHPAAAPFSVSVAALALALLSARGEHTRALTPVTFAAALFSPAWTWVVEQSSSEPIALLGASLAVSGLAMLELGRREQLFRPFGGVLLTLALFPGTELFRPFQGLSFDLSAPLLAGAAFVSALLSSSEKNRATAVAVAVTVLVGASINATVGLWFGLVPTLLLSGLAVLLTARALHPAFSVPFATLLFLGYSLPEGRTWAMLGQAVALTLVAFIPQWRSAHALLLGGKRVSTAASLSAAGVLLACALRLEVTPTVFHLAAFALLPLAWVRASRRSWMAVLLAPLMALLLDDNSGFSPLMIAVPITVALATRLIGQVPQVERWITEGDARRTRRVQGFALAGLGAVAIVLLMATGLSSTTLGGLVPGARPVLIAFALGFVCAGGSPLWLRLLAAAIVVAPVDEVRPLLMPAMMAVAFLAHHFPKQTHAVLGAEEDQRSPAIIALLAVAASLAPLLSGWPTNGDMLVTASAVLMASALVSQSWMIPVSLLLAASAGTGFLSVDQRWLSAVSMEAFVLVGLVGAGCSALLINDRRNERAQKLSQLVAPGFDSDLHLPLWFSGLLPAAGAALLAFSGVGTMSPMLSLLLFAAAGLLLITRDRVQTVMAAVLGSAVIVASVPFAWAPLAVASFGVALAFAGAWFEGELETADVLHHCGWVTAAASVLLCRSLHHIATPLTFAAIAAAAWVMVWRRREREVFGWAASLLFGHVLFFHLGVVLSTGKPAQYIFPYISMLSAVMAAVAAAFAGEKLRRTLLLTFGAISLVEVLCGVLLLPLAAHETAMREALVAAFGMGVLVVAMVRHAVRTNDVAAAYFAQVAILLGYFAVRMHGMVPHGFGTNDAIASLIAGAIFSGLYVWARRQDEDHVFVKPAWVGAVGLPLLGLLAAPWESPMVVACLLMAHAAHFAAAARFTDNKRTASMLATAAFNAALVFMWLGTGFGQPQYYVIPAALSLLMLVRAFRDDFTAEAQARLRAVAITAIYLAAAWPMLFENTWQMLLCAVICVVGVAVGVAMRIRSYVYLGTGFLVSSIVANLVRFGVRDPRLGALFLSLLGLMIVGFMIYLTAQRADVLRRFQRVRTMLSSWEV